jgi:ferric-dicitrate binding protein FerR (iron transport regulator)
LFDELKDVYEVSGILKKDDGDTDKSWKRVKANYKQRRLSANSFAGKENRSKWLPKFMRVAAVFAIAFLLGVTCNYLINQHQLKSEPLAYNEVIAPLGAKTAIILADGTKVWLNAGSKLKYPVDFSKASRDVYLEGEAYFNVTKMANKKFIVHTSHLNIKVLGTEFNVKAYPEEKTIQTTLIKGLVTIERLNKKESGPVYLKPSQQATFVKTDSNISLTSETKVHEAPKFKEPAEKIEQLVILPKVTTEIFTSWKDGRWLIKAEELQTLAVKLERRYDVKITFKNESLKKYKFSGILTDETFEQVLDIIKLIAPIEYSIDGKQVVFKENKWFKKTYDEALISR